MPCRVPGLRDRVRHRQQRAYTNELCGALVNQARVPIMLFDREGRLIRANESARAFTGRSLEEMLGRRCGDFLALPPGADEPGPGDDRELWNRICTGEPGTVRLSLRTRDGGEVPVMAVGTQLTVGGEPCGWACVFWDARRQVDLEREAQRRRQQIEGLAAMAREIGSLREQPQRLGGLLERACRLLDLDLAAWGMLDEYREELVWNAAHGPGADLLLGPLRTVGDSPLVRTLMTGRIYRYPGAGRPDPHLAPLPLRSFTAIPYRLGPRSQGVLLGASRRPGALVDDDLRLFNHLGAYLSTAAENAQLLRDMQHLAVLEERQRLAGEIHDHIGQVLTFLGMRLHVVERALAQDDLATAAEEVAGLRGVVASAHEEIRASLYDLRNDAPARSPLMDRWRQLLDAFAARTGIAVRIETPHRPMLVLPPTTEAQLTRILQEALANAQQHSGTSTVTVQARVERATLYITIADDGCGFDPSVPPDPHHFGLALMRERAQAIGARLHIESTRGRGTRISLEMPLPPRKEMEHEQEPPAHPRG